MSAEWRECPLGELCDVVAGQSPEGRHINAEGRGAPFYQGKKDFGDRFIGEPSAWTTHTTKMAEKGDVLMSVRAPVGPVNFAVTRACIGRGLAAIRARSGLEPDFLFYQLLHLQRTIAGTEGAVFNSISKSQIEAIPIVLTSLSEQRRIVGILDEAFAGIAAAEANAELKQLKLFEMFALELRSVFVDGGRGWVESTIGETCELKSGTTLPTELERPSGDVPYLKVADMSVRGNEERVTTSSRFVRRSDVRATTLIPAGATIFPKRGGAILTNKKRLTGRQICADLNIMAVVPSLRLDAEFLYFYFLQVDMRKIGTGSSIPQINNYDVAPLRIAFPASVEDQRLISTRLGHLRREAERFAALCKREYSLFNNLRRSFLHHAFTGQL